MWFIRTNTESSAPEMMHISSRENRQWMNEQIDLRLHKQGLLNADSKPEAIRADMNYLRRWRMTVQQINSGIIAAFIKTIIGGSLGFIGWAIVKLLGEIK